MGFCGFRDSATGKQSERCDVVRSFSAWDFSGGVGVKAKYHHCSFPTSAAIRGGLYPGLAKIKKYCYLHRP